MNFVTYSLMLDDITMELHMHQHKRKKKDIDSWHVWLEDTQDDILYLVPRDIAFNKSVYTDFSLSKKEKEKNKKKESCNLIQVYIFMNSHIQIGGDSFKPV